MAFNPQHEDYQRLWLRYADTLKDDPSANPTREFARFGAKFARNRDELPQTDADRAFHLVSDATVLLDYQAPFVSEASYRELEARAKKLLDEALTLDQDCFDAIRMRSVLDLRSFEAYYDLLSSQVGRVREAYEASRKEIEARAASDPEASDDRVRLELDLAQRPYLRWLAAWCEEALICGRNREAIRIAREAYKVDPRDTADLRFTEALALAKLEDAEGLEALRSRSEIPDCTRGPDDAWMQIARIGIAFKQNELQRAGDLLDHLLSSYLSAAEVLIRQAEIPDGLFSRFAAIPYSEDELILATSESTVLLQEGRDETGHGALSDWVLSECARRYPRAAYAVMSQQYQQGAAGPDDPQGTGAANGSGAPRKGGLPS